jgi:hypothetical protein
MPIEFYPNTASEAEISALTIVVGTKQASLSGATISSATVATNDKVLIQDTSEANALKYVTAQSIADLASGGGGSSTTFYSNTMTGDKYTVSHSLSNAAGGGLSQVGSVQVTGVVIAGTSDIIEIQFSALSIPSVTADLLLGYQIGANAAKWGNYVRGTTYSSTLSITTTGISAGTYTIKLMAAKSGTGTVDIAASDSTTYGIDQIPGGAIFTVKVTTP